MCMYRKNWTREGRGNGAMIRASGSGYPADPAGKGRRLATPADNPPARNSISIINNRGDAVRHLSETSFRFPPYLSDPL